MAWEDFLENLNEAQQKGTADQFIRKFLYSCVPESANLDYKWQVDLTKSKDKEKLAKWIAGFANSNGGILILGVKEYEDSGEPDLEEPICPVNIPNSVELTQHLTNIINGIVNPRPVFYPFPIDADSGQAAVLVVPSSNNKPHVVQKGDDYYVPIRRGTSTVTASRAELDLIYQAKVNLKEDFDQEAVEQLETYCPSQISQKPLCFIYATPVGTESNLISIDALRESKHYQNRVEGVPGWNGEHRLPPSKKWQGSNEAGIFDYPNEDSCEIEYRAVAYRNGAVATWTDISYTKNGSINIYPPAYFAALHGTLAPWLSFLTNLGVTSQVEIVVLLKNVAGHPLELQESDPLVDPREYTFKVDPKFNQSTYTPILKKEITELCFILFKELFYSCGYTEDYSDRNRPEYYASKLERELLHRH